MTGYKKPYSIQYQNGGGVKLHNRSVTVLSDDDSDQYIVEFAKATGKQENCALMGYRLGVNYTTIKLSRDAVKALHYLTGDVLKRIK